MNKGFWDDGGGWGTTSIRLSFSIHCHHPKKTALSLQNLHDFSQP